MDAPAPDPRRPRPVAGLPAVDGRTVAKAWLVELVAGAPLEDAARVPTAELAQEGPELAAAVVAAVSDDGALARLAPGGDLAWLAGRAGALAGATSAPSVVRAVEALRRSALGAVVAEARPDALTTAEVVDRLAHVCAYVAEAAVAHLAPGPPQAPAADEPPLLDDEPTTREDPRPAPVEPPGELPGVLSLHRTAEAPAERARRRSEPASWRAAVERGLERHAHDGSPFALLAVEADGVERLLAAQGAGEVDALLETLERALTAELRPADQLLGDGPGRYWVTAPDTGPAVGRLLAERLADGAAAAVSHRGIPLSVSIGIASCPSDGEDADTLAARADGAMFAARAAGTPVA